MIGSGVLTQAVREQRASGRRSRDIRVILSHAERWLGRQKCLLRAEALRGLLVVRLAVPRLLALVRPRDGGGFGSL